MDSLNVFLLPTCFFQILRREWTTIIFPLLRYQPNVSSSDPSSSPSPSFIRVEAAASNTNFFSRVFLRKIDFCFFRKND
jgi:hypothetical protein